MSFRTTALAASLVIASAFVSTVSYAADEAGKPHQIFSRAGRRRPRRSGFGTIQDVR